MSYREELGRQFTDKEYRDAYAEDFLNTKIAAQLRAIREQRKLTQKDLAEKIGTKQPGVARLEDVNYASWNITTLKKIASALDVRLNVSFETFGSLLDEDESFSRQWLQREEFADDSAFKVGAPTAASAGAGAGSIYDDLKGAELSQDSAAQPGKVLSMLEWKRKHELRQGIESPGTESSMKEAVAGGKF